jgi:hypothetical protein
LAAAEVYAHSDDFSGGLGLDVSLHVTGKTAGGFEVTRQLSLNRGG